MIDKPSKGQTVWFIQGGIPVSGTILSEKTIDGFYSVSVRVGIPKLLLPEEMCETREELRAKTLL